LLFLLFLIKPQKDHTIRGAIVKSNSVEQWPFVNQYSKVVFVEVKKTKKHH